MLKRNLAFVCCIYLLFISHSLQGRGSDFLNAKKRCVVLSPNMLIKTFLKILVVQQAQAAFQSENFAEDCRLLSLTNDIRVANNLNPLVFDDRLQHAAWKHAKDMADRDFFDHNTPDGVTVSDRVTAEGYQWRAVAENIAAGRSTVDDTLNDWMDSDGHRANILNGNYEHSGMAMYTDPNSNWKNYYVQVFASGGDLVPLLCESVVSPSIPPTSFPTSASTQDVINPTPSPTQVPTQSLIQAPTESPTQTPTFIGGGVSNSGAVVYLSNFAIISQIAILNLIWLLGQI